MATILRPMSIPEILDRTFYLYRKHFLVFFTIVAIPQLAMMVLRLVNIGIQPDELSVLPAISVLISLAMYLVVNIVAQSATIVAVSNVHLEKPVSIATSFAGIKGHLGTVLAIMILMFLGIMLGFIFCIIPGIFLALVWSLSIPSAIIENLHARDALARSWNLTEGNRWKILLILLLILVLVYVFVIIASLLLVTPIVLMEIPREGQSDPAPYPGWLTVYSAVISVLSSSLTMPILIIAISLIYYDQRVRKEGFDLHLMMSSLTTPTQEKNGT